MNYYNNSNDYKKLMNYFPPVNPNIENIVEETDYTYIMYNAISPLKPPPKNEFYSLEILINLRTLRLLLNSNISQERILYEINRLIKAWGPGGYYDKNILNSSLLELINKLNISYQKEQDFIKEGEKLTYDYQMKQLEDDISGISFKNKNYKYKNKDLDLSKLNISKSIVKKSNKYYKK